MKNKGIVEQPDGSVIIKAYGGDRAKNLNAIADEISNMLARAIEDNGDPAYPRTCLQGDDAHKLKGYVEQLGIIADEITGGNTPRR